MRYLLIILLSAFSLSLSAQADTIFVIGAEFGASTVINDSTFQLDIDHPADQLGQGFLPTQIQVGYQLFDIQGRLFRVSSVVSANFGQSTLQVVELQDNNIGPLGVGVVYRKPSNSDCVPRIPEGNTGLSPAIIAKIHNHNVVNGCGSGSGGGASSFTDLTDSPSSYSGQADRMVLVNPGETGLIFADTSGMGGGSDDQTAIEVPITDAGGYFIATEVENALQEEAVNRLAVDAIAGALTSLSGMPLLSTDLGTFTGDIITNNNTNKGALQELETAVEANQDSITALRGDIGSGGSTEVADGSTILGDGTGGDPFRVDSDLVNKQVGNYQRTADSLTYWPNQSDDSFNFSGALIINTGVKANTAFTNLYLDFRAPAVQSTTTTKRYTHIHVTLRRNSANTTFERASIKIESINFDLESEGNVGVDANGFLIISIGDPAGAGGRFNVYFDRVSADNAIEYDPTAFDVYGTTDLNTVFSAFESALTYNTAVRAGMQTDYLYTGSYTAATFRNSKNSNDELGVRLRFINRGNVPFDGVGPLQSNGLYFGSLHGLDGRQHFTWGIPFNLGDDATELLRLTREGYFGIRDTNPQHNLSIRGTASYPASIYLEPHDNVISTSEGVIWWGDSENMLKGHDGTTEFTFAKTSDITGGGTMSSWTLVTDDAIDMIVSDADNVDIIGGIGVDVNNPGVGAGAVVNMNLELIPVAEPLDGAERLLVYDSDGTNFHQLLDIDDLATYTADGNGVFSGSGTVPDFTSATTSLNAGVQWADDNISLRGDVFVTDVTTATPHTSLGLTSTNQIVEFTPQDTLVIPVYCHPHDEALTTGTSDYRGWRVPSHLGGATLIAIQYSFDTAGTGTPLIQLTNGTVNVGGLSVSGGYGEATLSQTLVTGEKWTPDATSIGTGNQGLMLNLIIVK